MKEIFPAKDINSLIINKRVKCYVDFIKDTTDAPAHFVPAERSIRQRAKSMNKNPDELQLSIFEKSGFVIGTAINEFFRNRGGGFRGNLDYYDKILTSLLPELAL